VAEGPTARSLTRQGKLVTRPCQNRGMQPDSSSPTNQPNEVGSEAVSEPLALGEESEAHSGEEATEAFDFDSYRRKAVETYEKVRPRYKDCADAVYTVLKTALSLEEGLELGGEHAYLRAHLSCQAASGA